MLIRKGNEIYYKDNDNEYLVSEIEHKVDFYLIKTICDNVFELDKINNDIFYPFFKGF